MNSPCALLIGLAAVAALAGRAPACLPFIEDESAPSAQTASFSLRDRLLQHHSRELWQTRVEQWRPVADKAFAFTSENNLAAALAHVGQYDEAMRRFQTIERVSPGHEFTAYNIATVYELQGDLPRALQWVKIGIAREQTETRRHPLDNTEWLHVRILEARLRAFVGKQDLGFGR